MAIGAVIKINGALEDLPVSQIEVTERLGESTRFRLRLPITIDDGGDFVLLADPRLDPGAKVTILVETTAGRDCLVVGVVHAHEIHFENGGEGSHVDVIGSDRMVEMNRENKAAIWPDGTASAAVRAICSSYGLTPDVEDTKATFSEAKHALVQRESDLGFVRRLARHNGSLFWITATVEGVETAHFRRPDLTAPPAAAIAINQGEPMDPIRIEFDVERPSSAKLAQQDFAATTPISTDVLKQPLPPLGARALEALRPKPATLHIAAPTDSSADLTARAEGALIEASFFVRAALRTTTARIGRAIRAHSIVSLGGVGRRHGGAYLCAAVIHFIDDTAHAMSVELVRNALEA